MRTFRMIAINTIDNEEIDSLQFEAHDLDHAKEIAEDLLVRKYHRVANDYDVFRD